MGEQGDVSRKPISFYLVVRRSPFSPAPPPRFSKRNPFLFSLFFRRSPLSSAAPPRVSPEEPRPPPHGGRRRRRRRGGGAAAGGDPRGEEGRQGHLGADTGERGGVDCGHGGAGPPLRLPRRRLGRWIPRRRRRRPLHLLLHDPHCRSAALVLSRSSRVSAAS